MSELNENVQEEAVKNESNILDALLAAHEDLTSEENWQTIKVKNKVPFSFRIHPLTEEQIEQCRKDSTPMIKNPAGKRLPKIEGETDYIKLRSLKIFRATVEDDQRTIWDNPTIKSKLGVLSATDVIDLTLNAGQKAQICDAIDRLSGFGDDEEDIETVDYVKN